MLPIKLMGLNSLRSLAAIFLDFFIKAIDSQGFKQIFELASLLKQIWLWQGSAARMTQEYKMAIDSSSKKRKVSYYKTPVDHQEYRSDEVLRHDDEEANEFYVKNKPKRAPHIHCFFNHDIKANLVKYLHGHIYNVLCESTCFGKYIQMHQCHVHEQIHRRCMALELNCSSRQAFVMRVNGSTLHFNLREFTLISGLSCVNEENDFIFDESEPNRFMEKYFEGVKLIRKIDIMRSFQQKVWGENHQDGLKFAILYFIQTMIFSGERATKKVP
ncbi:uncharacterized protein [Solanum lycopersicum]|uniref:uncharacterized protein isoform X1 n=1 Tax=Solanum lycopersicum TaxID=4081 RepID=UPI003748B1CE